MEVEVVDTGGRGRQNRFAEGFRISRHGDGAGPHAGHQISPPETPPSPSALVAPIDMALGELVAQDLPRPPRP